MARPQKISEEEALRLTVMRRKDHVKVALRQIETEQGMVTPQALVDIATDETSPLHDMFTWDDTEAAERFRLREAGQIIRTLRVVVEGRKTHAYFNAKVVVENVELRGYFPVHRVLAEDDLRRQVLQEALYQLHAWEKKYHDMEELFGVINHDSVHEVERKITKTDLT